MNNFGIIGVNIASQNLELLERLTIRSKSAPLCLQSLKTLADLIRSGILGNLQSS